MKNLRPQTIIQYLAVFLITLHYIPAYADDVWSAREAAYLLLLNNNSALPKPVYEDPANIPELSGNSFGVFGEHPVKVLSINNPGYPDVIVNQKAGNAPDEYHSNNAPSIRLKVDLFYPADLNTARPTVFFIAGYRLYASESYHNILYFIASHGYNCVYVSYEEQSAGHANHIKNILTQVVSDPRFSDRIDTSKVGYMGHSLAGGMLLHLANDLPAWGNSGRFIFTMAGWFAYFQDTKPYTIPDNTSLIVQTYNEELNDRPNNFDTDPRFSIDYLTSTTISNNKKTYLYLPGDADPPSTHSTPKSKYTLHGHNHFYFDALQLIGIFRPLQSIMSYSFDIDTINKEIGLPNTSPLMHSSNGIEYYSGDNPYLDLGMKDALYYKSDKYAYPYSGVTIASNKMFYDNGESITIHLEKMAGNTNDWIGIFPAGEDNVWGNQVAWLHTGGFLNGSLTFDTDNNNGTFPLPAGDYEAGAFFNDSVDKLEAKVTFTVRN
jgi:hypothetical protein